ncbi:hypothetical protein ACTFJW_08940 [Clostridium cagae]|uniref:hypothetical protein n=1 Tax=Clostridium cagae TaxID=2080751 RepID=UPI003F761E83
MRVVRGYLKDKGLVNIKLDNDSSSLDYGKLITDEKLLIRKVGKEDKGVIGLILLKIGKIFLYEDFTFKGIILLSGLKLEGNWSE